MPKKFKSEVNFLMKRFVIDFLKAILLKAYTASGYLEEKFNYFFKIF